MREQSLQSIYTSIYIYIIVTSQAQSIVPVQEVTEEYNPSYEDSKHIGV